jgi:hypothetical protein
MGGERYPGWSWDQDAPFPDEPLDDSVPAFSPDDPFGGAFETAPAATPAVRPAADPEFEPAEWEDEEEEEDEPEVAFAVREDLPAPPRGGKLTAFLLFSRRRRRCSADTAAAPPAAIPSGAGGVKLSRLRFVAPPVSAGPCGLRSPRFPRLRFHAHNRIAVHAHGSIARRRHVIPEPHLRSASGTRSSPAVRR